MNSPKISSLLLAGTLLVATSCQKDLLDQTNPNAPTTAQFWKTADDANKSILACYSGVQQFACYGHSWQFITARSDESYSQSPFVELAIFTRFVQANNNFFISSFAWNDYYRTIYRTNQSITHIPAIEMDSKLKAQLLAEARFVRALMYFDLDSFFGNVPLILTESTVGLRVKQATPAEIEAQVISDLQAAIPDLPQTYGAADKGRATRGAAQALLAKMYMQQRKWAEASALFTTIIGSNTYSLTPNYLDNFLDGAAENNSESVFEVQYTGSVLDVGQGQDNASSSEAYDRPNFFGPPIYSFSDVQPRQWLTAAYTDSTVALAPGSTTKHQIDPRRDISIISALNPDRFYGKTFQELGYNPNQQYWRKYLNDRTRTTTENFTSGINFRVIRYADVLLLQAEALNELGQTTAAVPLVNQVRQRVGLAPIVAANYTQNSLRLYMRTERGRELAGEGQRWFDILRWGLLDNQAGLDDLKTRDIDFNSFVLGKSKLLPIPQNDIDIDPGIKQNPGY